MDPKVFPRMFLGSDKSRILVGPKIFFLRWCDRFDEEELKEGCFESTWCLETFLVERNLEEWRWEKSLFLVSNEVFLFMNSVSEDKLEHEDKHSEWFFEVENESNEDEVGDRLEDLWTFVFSMGAVEDKIDDEMHGVKESEEDKFLMKDFDPFFLWKRSSNSLSSNFFFI